jgi:hypothetical protein
MDTRNVLQKYLVDEMSKFRDRRDLRSFVESLDMGNLCLLCQQLSNWRKNEVATYLLGGGNWVEESVSVATIKLPHINERVNDLLARHDWQLDRVAADPAVCGHEEFRDQGTMISDVLLVKKVPDGFLVVDGAHRAVKLACDGQQQLPVIYRRDGT